MKPSYEPPVAPAGWGPAVDPPAELAADHDGQRQWLAQQRRPGPFPTLPEAIAPQWPQERLHVAGLSEHSSCQLCGGPGSLWHRLYDCPAGAGWRAPKAHAALWLRDPWRRGRC